MLTVRLKAAAVVVAVLSVGLMPVAAAATVSKSVTGDPAAIAFYRLVVKATSGERRTLDVATGFTQLEETQTAVSWRFGEAKLPGYVKATDHVVISAAHRKVVWLTDLLVPDNCTPTANRRCDDVKVVLDHSGVFFHLMAKGSSACYVSAQGSIFGYTKVGVASGYSLYGRFLPLKQVGGNVDVTSIYPYGHQQATEVDTVSPKTHLPSVTVVHVAGGGLPKFAYRDVLHWSMAPATLPTFSVCS